MAEESGKPTDEIYFPVQHNKLCPSCMPDLPSHPVVGAEVAVRMEDARGRNVFARGTVLGPAAPLAVGESFFSLARPWRVEWRGQSMLAGTTLSTESIRDAAGCRAALDRDEQFALQRMRDVQLREQRAEQQRTEESERRSARMPASPPAAAPEPCTAPAPPPAPPAPELIRTKRDVWLKLPLDAAAGKVVRVTLPKDFLRGSPEQVCEFCAPAGSEGRAPSRWVCNGARQSASWVQRPTWYAAAPAASPRLLPALSRILMPVSPARPRSSGAHQSRASAR